MTEIALHNADSRHMPFLSDNSIELIVTSPPYPMIAMWDNLFASLNPEIGSLLAGGRGADAFELMNRELDKVWRECFRVLVPGGLLCLNIGDAVRTLNGDFQIYSSHARILTACAALGFLPLPEILWRKPTNAPNKFMGSGMLPGGAYVTLEHEYILILRKGGKRGFTTIEEKQRRRQSAFFWEERNLWFSDVWTFTGALQKLPGAAPRDRSAAFPLELASRLINMYSLQGDTVMDPFLGTGTTLFAALAAGRSAAGIELEPHFLTELDTALTQDLGFLNSLNIQRLEAHVSWVTARQLQRKSFKHTNSFYGFPVMTAQERDLVLPSVKEVSRREDRVLVEIGACPGPTVRELEWG